jgi:hypothetical protein
MAEVKTQAVMKTRDLLRSSSSCITGRYQGSAKVDCHRIQETTREAVLHRTTTVKGNQQVAAAAAVVVVVVV